MNLVFRIFFSFALVFSFTWAYAYDHALFTEILKSHVKNGKVDYQGIKYDQRMDRYLNDLKNIYPSRFSNQRDKLAFWINAYNAFTLKLVADNYPVSSIKKIRDKSSWTPWGIRFIRIGGRMYSLDDIEHRVIRKKFNDPRIHFALVCAAKSCPPLRREAYRGIDLNNQLNDQGRIFLANTSLNRFDAASKHAAISSIFKWFKKDFGGNNEELLLYIGKFLSREKRESIQQNTSQWKIKYLSYNWSLNE